MAEFLIRLVAKLAFRLARYWILHRSDKHLARSLRLVRRIVFAFTGEPILLTAFNDLIEIFEGGGRDTELIRRIMRETTPEYAETILRSLLRKD